MKTIGHKLAGNAGSYGFTELGDYGANIENACINEDIATIQTNINQIKDYLNALEIKYI